MVPAPHTSICIFIVHYSLTLFDRQRQCGTGVWPACGWGHAAPSRSGVS